MSEDFGGQPDPSRFEMSRVVERERARANPRSSRQEPGLDQHLEAVADPQDQAAAVEEPAERVA